MTIFDSIPRDDVDPKRYCEPLFAFMNRCGWTEAATIRTTLEKWYSEIPPPNQKDLRNRFRSGDDFNYNSAFFELVLYAMLNTFGSPVDMHPASPTGKKRPDFLIRERRPFFLEAAVVSDESAQEHAAKQRMNTVYDAINKLQSPDFFIGLELHGAPATPPSSRSLRRFLEDKLSDLDYVAVRTALEASGSLDCMPHWRYSHEGWSIDFFPIPKSPAARGSADARPVGALIEEGKWRDGCKGLRETLSKKAGRYGQLDIPYIIAVNAIDHADDIDVRDALFGQECLEVAGSESGACERPNRMRNGVLWGPDGARNTRVSAVLVAFGLNHSNIAKVRVCLYHNPWASRPYDGALCQFGQLIPIDGRLEPITGRALGEILGLPAEWPDGAAN